MDKRFQIFAVLRLSSLVMVPIIVLSLYVVLNESEKSGSATADKAPTKAIVPGR